MSTGAVFDTGYQRYQGEREGRDRAVMAVFKDGVRIALGLGRGPRAKVLPWFFIAVLNIIALVMALVVGAAERLGGPGTAERAHLPGHADYYAIASMVLFVFAAVVGPELLTRDKREGSINLYLVRPLTSSDYLIARACAFLAVLTAATWLPQLILLIGLAGGAPAPGAYLAAHWLDIPRFLVAGFARAASALRSVSARCACSTFVAALTSRRFTARISAWCSSCQPCARVLGFMRAK